jgi:hypothetical protein
VVVAELFAAKAWAAAAMAVGEDVAALVSLRFVDDCVDDWFHSGPLLTGVVVVQSLQKTRPRSGLSVRQLACCLNKKIRLVAGLRLYRYEFSIEPVSIDKKDKHPRFSRLYGASKSNVRDIPRCVSYSSSMELSACISSFAA